MKLWVENQNLTTHPSTSCDFTLIPTTTKETGFITSLAVSELIVFQTQILRGKSNVWSGLIGEPISPNNS